MNKEHKHQFSLTKEPGGKARMVCECQAGIKITQFSAELIFDVEDEA